MDKGVPKIKINYNGEYPNLCSGILVVVVCGKTWTFPRNCLISGGSVSFDDDWNECVTEGPWSIDEWPKEFPDYLKETILHKINEEIPKGCCGGCV